MPQNVITSASRAELHYFDQLGQGNFVIPHCRSCDRFSFYPRVLCPHCGSDQQSWIAPSGRASVYSVTIVRARSGDYTVCLVDLEEGPRMMSRVVDVEPEAVRIGMALQARIDQVDGAPLLVFVPQEAV